MRPSPKHRLSRLAIALSLGFALALATSAVALGSLTRELLPCLLYT
jgi:hypothetical protein